MSYDYIAVYLRIYNIVRDHFGAFICISLAKYASFVTDAESHWRWQWQWHWH